MCVISLAMVMEVTVLFLMKCTVYHHGIITEDKKDGEVTELLPQGYRVSNLREFLTGNDLFVIDYEEGTTVSTSESANLAKYKAMDNEPYNAMDWNCEIFVTFCKTGKKQPSEQVVKFINALQKDVQTAWNLLPL